MIPEKEPEKRLLLPRKAAGAQITQSRHGEVVTKNNNTGVYNTGNWNEYNLNPLTSINWRASLVPAAAVIPAPIAYIKVVAVKKLVVGFWNQRSSVRQEWCVLVSRFSLLDTRYCTLLGGSFIAARWWMQEGSGG